MYLTYILYYIIELLESFLLVAYIIRNTEHNIVVYKKHYLYV